MTSRIAVVGGGVSGLVVAHLLHPTFDITLFEASDRVGGHVHTVDVSLDGQTWAVDTGFIVYNERNYPNFTKLLADLRVETQPSTMSFSVKRTMPELEYNGSTIRQLFVQRRNLVRPAYYRMLWDIVRFNRMAPSAVQDPTVGDQSLGAYVEAGGYSKYFVHNYLIPMGSAIWSSPADAVLEMPAGFFIRFFDNHGMLTIDDRPEWRVIRGGSREYVEKLISPFRHCVRTGHEVKQVRRSGNHVLIDGEQFDHVVMACHADQALALLHAPTAPERAILESMPYQENDIVLHTDATVLPRRRAAWAAWNYHLGHNPSEPVGVTYNMNILQTLNASRPLCVTLNDHGDISDDAVLYRTRFAHPQFTRDAVIAQRKFHEISGIDRVHYCGAYWGNGFHEDGVKSAFAVARGFGVTS